MQIIYWINTTYTILTIVYSYLTAQPYNYFYIKLSQHSTGHLKKITHHNPPLFVLKNWSQNIGIEWLLRLLGAEILLLKRQVLPFKHPCCCFIGLRPPKPFNYLKSYLLIINCLRIVRTAWYSSALELPESCVDCVNIFNSYQGIKIIFAIQFFQMQ